MSVQRRFGALLILLVVPTLVALIHYGYRQVDRHAALGYGVMITAMACGVAFWYWMNLRPAFTEMKSFAEFLLGVGYAVGDKRMRSGYRTKLQHSFLHRQMTFEVDSIVHKHSGLLHIVWGVYGGGGRGMEAGVFCLIELPAGLPMSHIVIEKRGQAPTAVATLGDRTWHGVDKKLSDRVNSQSAYSLEIRDRTVLLRFDDGIGHDPGVHARVEEEARLVASLILENMRLLAG
jgi:hypothetical protein